MKHISYEKKLIVGNHWAVGNFGWGKKSSNFFLKSKMIDPRKKKPTSIRYLPRSTRESTKRRGHQIGIDEIDDDFHTATKSSKRFLDKFFFVRFRKTE